MKNYSLLFLATVIGMTGWANSSLADDAGKVPLVLKLPSPTLKGTPEDLPKNSAVESIPDQPPVFLVPKGATNVALGKTVTSSVRPFTGELRQVTDGSKEATDGDAVEMKKGAQWVQVDLGADYAIDAIVVWHDHRYIQVVHDVVMEVSDDPDFKTGVTILFNNDKENYTGQGIGTDREYYETNRGKIIDGKGTKARYVRGYTHGSTQGALNCWQEIEVYAVPAN